LRVALIYAEENLDDYPTYEKMYESIYGINKMMMYFWKSPNKMIEDEKTYRLVLDLGKKYNVRHGV
jgi:hypothetical protein